MPDKYYAFWDYDDCLHELMDFWIKSTAAVKIMESKSKTTDYDFLAKIKQEIISIINHSSCGKKLDMLGSCSLRIDRLVDRMNFHKHAEYLSDSRLLSNDLTLISNSRDFTNNVSFITVVDIFNSIVNNMHIRDTQHGALFGSVLINRSGVHNSKFFLWLLLAQRAKALNPTDHVYLDFYDDKFFDKSGLMYKGIMRLKQETILIPENIHLRFHRLDAYALFNATDYESRGDVIFHQINKVIAGKLNFDNFKPVTSIIKTIACIDGTGPSMDNGMLKYIGDQCFCNSEEMVDVTDIKSPIKHTDEFIISITLQALTKRVEIETITANLLTNMMDSIEIKSRNVANIKLFNPSKNNAAIKANEQLALANSNHS